MDNIIYMTELGKVAREYADKCKGPINYGQGDDFGPHLKPLTDPKVWFARRDAMFAAARSNMKVLMSGYWRFDRNDPLLLEANARWIVKAKRAHGIALGRLPLYQTINSDGIPVLVYVNGREVPCTH